MTREEILKGVRKFFDAEELVCDHTYARFGESSWDFLDTDYLHCLLIIRRDILGKPMWCNGSQKHQRGLRCNRCEMVRSKSYAYLSAHVLGKGGDFSVSGMTAEQVRNKIRENASLLPCQIRMERGVSWLHFDVRPTERRNEKIVEFDG